VAAAREFFSKPVDFEKLKAAIATLLNSPSPLVAELNP